MVGGPVLASSRPSDLVRQHSIIEIYLTYQLPFFSLGSLSSRLHNERDHIKNYLPCHLCSSTSYTVLMFQDPRVCEKHSSGQFSSLQPSSVKLRISLYRLGRPSVKFRRAGGPHPNPPAHLPPHEPWNPRKSGTGEIRGRRAIATPPAPGQRIRSRAPFIAIDKSRGSRSCCWGHAAVLKDVVSLSSSSCSINEKCVALPSCRGTCPTSVKRKTRAPMGRCRLPVWEGRSDATKHSSRQRHSSPIRCAARGCEAVSLGV